MIESGSPAPELKTKGKWMFNIFKKKTRRQVKEKSTHLHPTKGYRSTSAKSIEASRIVAHIKQGGSFKVVGKKKGL